jgi:nucleotide-binding universal stress UspA family protein
MKAIVGLDGSTNSLAAVEFVAGLLSPARDQIVLLYSLPELSFSGDDALDQAVQARARTALGRVVFDEAQSRLPATWRGQVEEIAAAGHPAAELLAGVEEHGAGLVVVGFRGASLFERVMLGSVSRAVVHSASVPVLVVKIPPAESGGGPQASRAAGRPFRILVAYDGPDYGERIASLLREMQWPQQAEGRLMTVVKPLYAAELPEWLRTQTRDPDVAAMATAWQKEHEQNVQAARGKLEEYRKSLPACFTGHDVIVAEGRPAEKLLETMGQGKFDLAVVGSRGGGAVARLLLGSTSDQVLNGAPASVLIVR